MENKTDTTAEEDYRDHLRIENPEDPYNGNPEEKYVMRGEEEVDQGIIKRVLMVCNLSYDMGKDELTNNLECLLNLSCKEEMNDYIYKLEKQKEDEEGKKEWEKEKLYWEKIKLQAIIERMCLNIK